MLAIRRAPVSITPDMTLKRAARAYTVDGWPVFVLSESKVPVGNCRHCTLNHTEASERESCGCLTCHGFYAATTDLERVRDMLELIPGGWLAVRLGERAGLCVVDIDAPAGGFRSASELTAKGYLPNTVTVITSHGVHLYYRHPGITVQSRPLRLNGQPAGIDIKADGGYCVLPPSGRRYRWYGGRVPDRRHLPVLHSALRSPLPEAVALPSPLVPDTGPMVLRAPVADARPVQRGGLPPTPGVLPLNVERMRDWLLARQPGERNNALHWAAAETGRAMRAGRLPVPLGHVQAVLLDTAVQMGLGASEARGTIRSGLQAEGVRV